MEAIFQFFRIMSKLHRWLFLEPFYIVGIDPFISSASSEDEKKIKRENLDIVGHR